MNQKKKVDCYREAAKAVVAAGLNIYLPDRSQSFAGAPADLLESVLISHLSGTIAVKFWIDPEWTLAKDSLTYAQVFPLLIYLCPDDPEDRKAKFRKCFKAATACVRYCETYIKAAALALEDDSGMDSVKLRRLCRSFFEEPAGRGGGCFGCGGAL